MNNFIELHDAKYNKVIALNVNSIICIESVKDLNGNEIGAVVGISGAKELWTTKETYSEILNILKQIEETNIINACNISSYDSADCLNYHQMKSLEKKKKK